MFHHPSTINFLDSDNDSWIPPLRMLIQKSILATVNDQNQNTCWKKNEQDNNLLKKFIIVGDLKNH